MFAPNCLLLSKLLGLWNGKKHCAYYVSVCEAYLEPCQTCKMERFVKIITGFKPIAIFEKSSILLFDKVLNMPLAYMLTLRERFFLFVFEVVKVKYPHYTPGIMSWILSILVILWLFYGCYDINRQSWVNLLEVLEMKDISVLPNIIFLVKIRS